MMPQPDRSGTHPCCRPNDFATVCFTVFTVRKKTPVRTMNPMRNANDFKLGLFSINADGGTAFTKVPNRWRADWPDIERAVQHADAAGLEFILPIARWKGYGGETTARAASFETLTHAAAL